MMNTWVLLVLAGMFEIGWPLGFKLAQTLNHRIPCIALSVISMAISGWLLFLAQKSIPIGTAYAVWTGIGATGTFLVGVLCFGDMMNAGRLLGVVLIIGGVMVLKTCGSS